MSKWMQLNNDYVIPNTLETKIFDYYEILNDEIIYTNINADYTFIIRVFNTLNGEYTNELYDQNTNYSIVNKALDINETVDALIFYTNDTLTNIHEKIVHKKYYGLYEYSKNICVINPDSNCRSYVYIRY